MTIAFLIFLGLFALLSVERWYLITERLFGGLTYIEFFAILLWFVSFVTTFILGLILLANWLFAGASWA